MKKITPLNFLQKKLVIIYQKPSMFKRLVTYNEQTSIQFVNWKATLLI